MIKTSYEAVFNDDNGIVLLNCAMADCTIKSYKCDVCKINFACVPDEKGQRIIFEKAKSSIEELKKKFDLSQWKIDGDNCTCPDCASK